MRIGLEMAVVLTLVGAVSPAHARQGITVTTMTGGAGAGPAPPLPIPAGSGLIVGQVLEAGTNEGVADVTVSLTLTPAPGAASQRFLPSQVLTGADGRFFFGALPAGEFHVTATKSGYTSGAAGREAVNGPEQPIDLADGAKAGDVAIEMWRYGVITGTVTDEAGEPVVEANVTTYRRVATSGAPRFVQTPGGQTDDRGIYRIANLAPGDYVVGAASVVTTVPASLHDAYPEMVRSPGGTVMGDLLASRGVMPSTNAIRVGTSYVSVNGLGRVGPVPPAPADDGSVWMYPTTFYPGASTPSAAALVTIGSGDTRQGIDLSLRLALGRRISGTVTSSDASPAHLGVNLSLTGGTSTAGGNAFVVATTDSDASGAFTFLGVPPGDYVLSVIKPPAAPPSNATPTITVIDTGSGMITSGFMAPDAGPPALPTGPTLTAEQPVSVADTDISGLEVALHPGARVSGRIEFDGKSDKPDARALDRMSIRVERADGQPLFFRLSAARAAADGTFQTTQLPAGKYVLTATLSSPWTIESIDDRGHDISSEPLDVGAGDVTDVVMTFTDTPTRLTGTVRDDQGATDAKAGVLVFPADKAQWVDAGPAPRRMKSLRPNKGGVFTTTGLPEGDYLLVAVPAGSVGADWRDPENLGRLAALATPVHLNKGESRTQDLKTAAAPRHAPLHHARMR